VDAAVNIALECALYLLIVFKVMRAQVYLLIHFMYGPAPYQRPPSSTSTQVTSNTTTRTIRTSQDE